MGEALIRSIGRAAIARSSLIETWAPLAGGTSLIGAYRGPNRKEAGTGSAPTDEVWLSAALGYSRLKEMEDATY